MLGEGELVTRVEANFLERSRRQSAAIDGGEVRERGGVLVAATGLPLAVLNGVFITRPLENPEASLGEMMPYFDDRDLPFVVRIREGLDPATERAAEAFGLQHVETMAALALCPLAAGAETPSTLEIRRAADERSLKQYAGILWPEMGRQLWPKAALELVDTQYYVGFLDGEPVAASSLVMSHRVAGVYGLATREEFRRRGFGTAMTRHAVGVGAKAGCALAGLQTASEVAHRLFERIGFRTVAAYRTYGRPATWARREA